MNYIFGGFTSAAWNCENKFIQDAAAYIFSLRRNGVSQSEKFNVTNKNSAIFGYYGHGPRFGNDIFICDQSNLNAGSGTHFGHSYEQPASLNKEQNPKSYLGGNSNQWLVTEIEVYQIKI